MRKDTTVTFTHTLVWLTKEGKMYTSYHPDRESAMYVGMILHEMGHMPIVAAPESLFILFDSSPESQPRDLETDDDVRAALEDWAKRANARLGEIRFEMPDPEAPDGKLLH